MESDALKTDDKGLTAESVNSAIFELELELSRLGSDINCSSTYEHARTLLVGALTQTCQISGVYTGQNLERVLGKIESATIGHRTASIILIRCMAVEGLLPLDEQPNVINRKLLSIIESHVPDLLKFLRLEKQMQTYEKINIIRAFHGNACTNYTPLNQVSGSISEIATQKAILSKALKHKQFQSYLQPFNYVQIKTKLEGLLEGIDGLASCNGSEYKQRLDEIELTLEEAQSIVESCHSFFTTQFAQPFLETVRNAIGTIKNTSSERLSSHIEPLRKPPGSAEKKYPLHQSERYINILIPLINRGPGTALNVSVEVDCGDESDIILENENVSLGDVSPGNFAVYLRACIVNPCKKAGMTIEITWAEIFGETKSQIFDITIEGQNEKVDWASLEALEPYSLEVAEGDMFVGRGAKVKAIANKLLKRPMTSTYITGQKRIGKTSLAKAVVDYLEREHKDFHSLYLEYGEYCSATPEKTLKSLGENIFHFLSEYFSATDAFTPDFSESIADLNLAAKKLETKSPTKKFIIILDEFDEIHPELYRSGPLAETFFANLRTLAARKNLAFILVGGEKMPFIIGAQGDQLNKFSRQTVDYFSRSEEWVEYLELITKPVEGKLNWNEASINEIFKITHGHPYYTKLVCSKIVSSTVSERDTEITESNITSELPALLSELDTNAFAHLWKDGISFEREQAEVAELKRLRLLVGIGRSFRENKRLEDDAKRRAVCAQLQEHEITPLIDDFKRREILSEREGELYFTVPLFELWLKDFGLNKLITSTLGDDYEDAIRAAEDKAHVSAQEIQNLVNRWPSYRAQKVNGEQIRAWLDQVPDILDQRMLFKILDNIRFLTPTEIDDYLKIAHSKAVHPSVGASTVTRRTDRRNDIWVTFADGIGKSGLQYARMYAKSNAITTTCIFDPATITRKLSNLKDEIPPKAVVLIDDVVGSGDTLSSGILNFGEEFSEALLKLDIPLIAIALISTEEGERKVNSALSKLSIKSELHICEIIPSSGFAFLDEEISFWNDISEMHRAKALCRNLGSKLYKNPLGFKGQGLLLVLPETCPNNSLPILYRTKKEEPSWTALFPRPVS
ncbi:ATP-binding protein [Pseudomonas sp. X4]|uniref:phosphoribosyltransferase-like protein n=1 Tax=unclassified Pseudomonas TaxID=196821 RepID=UPI0034602225